MKKPKKLLPPRMTGKEIAAASEALINWFASQDIGINDAVPIMVNTLCASVHAVARDANNEREGRAVIAAMIVGAEKTPL